MREAGMLTAQANAWFVRFAGKRCGWNRSGRR